MARRKRHKAPGKASRKGMTVMEVVRKFDNEEAAEDWFIRQRWPGGIACPHCGSKDRIQPRKSRRPMPFFCGDCRKYFSARTGTAMQHSKIPLRKWVMAMYLYSTNLKGVSSMKLHRDIGVTQKTAWFMAHRLREAWNVNSQRFTGPTEVDETYVGGREHNKHASNRAERNIGKRGKAIVIGAKDRPTNQISAAHIDATDSRTLHGFVIDNTVPGATIYTDEARGYKSLPRFHQAVNHSAGEFVRGVAHTNGLESFWALLKRGYHGSYHKMSVKHLERYVNEFAGRHNQRPMDTIDQMAAMARGLNGKRLTYEELIGPPETRRPGMIQERLI